MTRWLSVEGLANLRDAGGLPLRGGGRTRAGVLLRSESLEAVPPVAARQLLDAHGVRVVVDLRTPTEIELRPSATVAAAGVPTVALTLIGSSRDALPEAGDDTDPMLRAYRGYLSDHPANVIEAVRRIAELESGAALVHCAAGKDRTGVVVALTLDAVGVERDAIVADYVLSAERVEAMFRRWTAASGKPMPADVDAHKPRRAVMTEFLAGIDTAHGGAEGWLRAHGLAAESLARLRARLTDGAG